MVASGLRADMSQPGVTRTMEFVRSGGLEVSPLETLSLEGLVRGDASAVVTFARGLSEALAGPDGDGARRRMLAKALAAERALQVVLEAVLVEQLAKGNTKALGSVNALLDATVRRLERLAAAHRADVQADRRAMIVVGHADEVNVAAG